MIKMAGASQCFSTDITMSAYGVVFIELLSLLHFPAAIFAYIDLKVTVLSIITCMTENTTKQESICF